MEDNKYGENYSVDSRLSQSEILERMKNKRDELIALLQVPSYHVSENRLLEKDTVTIIDGVIFCENIYTVILGTGTLVSTFEQRLDHCVDFAKHKINQSIDEIVERRVDKFAAYCQYVIYKSEKNYIDKLFPIK